MKELKINEKAYLALLAASQEAGWPERYHRDLYELDASLLGCFPMVPNNALPEGMPFGWVLRDAGTFLDAANLDPRQAMSRVLAQYLENHDNRLRAMRNPIIHDMWENYATCDASTYLYFWWDGDTLMRVPSPRTILDRMQAWREANNTQEGDTANAVQ